MSILNFIYRRSAITNKIPRGSVCVCVSLKTDKLILKFKVNSKNTRTAKAKLKKNKPENMYYWTPGIFIT